MTRRKRVQAEALGRWAETAAALLLMAKGYRLLGRRVRTGFGELDIVAQKRGVLIAVEVKARGRGEDAFFAVSPRQRDRLARAAEAFAHRHGLGHASIRFDLIAVSWSSLRHVRGAWLEGDR